MKIIELRTHTIKNQNDEITPEGVLLAKRIGLTIPQAHYQRFVSSPAPWCITTMLHFGIPQQAIEIDERFGAMPQAELEKYRKKGEPVIDVGRFFQTIELQPLLDRTGRQVLTAMAELAQQLPIGGQALVVSHGGTIIPAAHFVQPIDFTKLSCLPECGGIRFFFEETNAMRYELFAPLTEYSFR